MSDIQQQIAALAATLALLPPDSPNRSTLEGMLRDLQAQVPPAAQTGGVNLGGATIDRVTDIIGGDAVDGDKVLGDKIVQQFFDGQPGEDGATLLRDYLVALLDAQRMLRLSRMTEQRQSGAGHDLLPPLRLADVFTNLVTDGPPLLVQEAQRSVQAVRRLEEWLDQRRSPDQVRPERVRHLQVAPADEQSTARASGRPDAWHDLPDDAPLTVTLTRPEPALEAVARTPRLVLLGAPGSGKSTALRYLALLLARHLLDPDRRPLPPGWPQAPIPLLCPLGLVAGALTPADPASDTEVLWRVLMAQLEGEGQVRAGLGRHLRPALRNGAVLLLLDGLDEIAAIPGPDGRSLRARVSRAVQALARELPHATGIVLTCRVLPYDQPPATLRDDWRLPPDTGWTRRTLQPFALGQVRQFVRSWYTAACHTPAAIYAPAEGRQRATSLLAQIQASERLRSLTTAPLLLTMLAILHYNKATGELPRDRARLYDECVTLLLERWEPVRTPELTRPGLLERLEIDRLATREDLARGDAHGGLCRARPPARSGRWARLCAGERTGGRDEPPAAPPALRPDCGTLAGV